MLGTILLGLGLASGVASLFTSGKTSNSLAQGSQLATGAANYSNQLQTQAYNRDLQRQAWDRDDSYYQRLVNDLESAGINPAVAAEKSAQASSYHVQDPAQVQAQLVDDFVKSQITMNQQQFNNVLSQQTANANNSLTLAKAEEQAINNEITKEMISHQPGGIRALSNLKYDMMMSNLARSNSFVANLATQNDLMKTQVALNDMDKIIQAERAGIISKENSTYYMRQALDYLMKGANTAINAVGAYNYGRFNDSYESYVDALSTHYGNMDNLAQDKFNFNYKGWY